MWRWILEEKLNLKHRCPYCKKTITETKKVKSDEYCKSCGSNVTNYIYFRKNVRYFGIKGFKIKGGKTWRKKISK